MRRKCAEHRARRRARTRRRTHAAASGRAGSEGGAAGGEHRQRRRRLQEDASAPSESRAITSSAAHASSVERRALARRARRVRATARRGWVRAAARAGSGACGQRAAAHLCGGEDVAATAAHDRRARGRVRRTDLRREMRADARQRRAHKINGLLLRAWAVHASCGRARGGSGRRTCPSRASRRRRSAPSVALGCTTAPAAARPQQTGRCEYAHMSMRTIWAARADTIWAARADSERRESDVFDRPRSVGGRDATRRDQHAATRAFAERARVRRPCPAACPRQVGIRQPRNNNTFSLGEPPRFWQVFVHRMRISREPPLWAASDGRARSGSVTVVCARCIHTP